MERDRLLVEGERIYQQYFTAVILSVQAAADRLQLHATDLHAFTLLASLGPLTAGELAARTGLTTGAATRLADRLERSGFLRRTVDGADRRRVILEAVPGRAANIERVFEPISARMAQLFRRYTAGEVAVLIDYFSRATPILHKAAEATRPTRRGRPAPQ